MYIYKHFMFNFKMTPNFTTAIHVIPKTHSLHYAKLAFGLCLVESAN